MPIYEYRCDSCGFQKEYLLRMSDAPLTDCPDCKKSTFSKMVTAAGFQLKGSGWYATDFRGGNSPKSAEKKESDGAKSGAAAPPAASTSDKSSDKPSAKTAESKTVAPAAPAATTSSS